MKQYLISSPTAAEAAIADGARWLTLSMPGATDDELAQTIRSIIPVANEAGIILVVQGHPELALNTLVDDKIRVSGVILSAADLDPAEARELLGPHAIIGYAATTPDEILRLAPLDVDYFTLPASAMSPALAAVPTPIVAVGATELPEGFMGILTEF